MTIDRYNSHFAELPLLSITLQGKSMKILQNTLTGMMKSGEQLNGLLNTHDEAF